MKKASPRETVWIFEKSELPEAYKGKNLEDKRHLQRIPIHKQEEIIRLSKLGKSRPEIARAVGVSKQTVYAYQKLYGLL